MKNNYPAYWLIVIILLLVLAGNVFVFQSEGWYGGPVSFLNDSPPVPVIYEQIDPNIIDFNGDGYVNLIDFTLFVNFYQEINRTAPLIGGRQDELAVLKKEREIMWEKVKDFNWFLYWGEIQWSIDPNNLIELCDPNYAADYWWRKSTMTKVTFAFDPNGVDIK